MELHLPYKLLIVSIIYSLAIAYFVGEASKDALIISAVLVVFGLALGLWTKQVIKKHKTTLNPTGKPANLITARPFTLSRNPMYASYVMMTLGVAIYSNHWAGFISPILYFLYLNFVAIPREEKNLTTAFPESYMTYKNKVRRWL